MNRWILAVGLLLGAGLSLAHADYLRIIYNVGASQNPNNPQGDPNRPQIPGGVMIPGGKPPGGVGGVGIPIQPPGGIKPPGGGKAPPGLPIQQPKPPIPGQPGIGPGAKPPTNQDPSKDDENAIRADVVVEGHFRKNDFLKLWANEQRTKIEPYPKFYHAWGVTAISPTVPDITIEEVKEDGVSLPSVAIRYKTQRSLKLKDKDGKDKTPEVLLELAEWALNHAMLEEFTKIMEELRAVSASHPVLKAFDQVQGELKKSVHQDDPTLTFWKDKLGNFKVKRSSHYALLFGSSQAEPPEVLAYTDRLEDNMRGFYYWFALKGKALPVPTYRLLAVLLDKEEFIPFRRSFDNAPLVADGFYAKRENLAVFSAARLDEAFELVTRATAPLWQNNWNVDDLLQAKGRPGAQPAEVIRNQMLALLLKGMQEESALATVSHDGTRQLIFSSGLLAHNVAIPEWVQFGEASFFETPKGAFWPGIGAPSWRYGVKFKLWRSKKTIDPYQDAIRNVITDKYFRDIKSESDKDAVTKARTMSWSLTYFLMSKHLDQLQRYFQELNCLPRDMEFDAEVLTLAFARAFDLMADPTHVHPQKLDALAKEWYEFIDLTPIESSEAMRDAVKRYESKQKKSTTTKPTQPQNPKKAPDIKLPVIKPKIK